MQLELLNEQGQATAKVEAPDTVFARDYNEALVHQVLFVRELYSQELFERQRLYGIAVRRARHPDLAAYVADAVAGLRVGV